MSEDRFLEAALGMRSKLYHAALAILWNEQDAADAMQEAMLKGWLRRGSLRDEGLFEVWFMRILVNQCRDLQRRQLRGRRLLERIGLERRREVEPPPDSTVLEAIHRLPDRLRLPVLLYYFEGYSQKEIGAIVGATPEQVKARVRQAREKLRKELADEVDWDWTRGGGSHE